MAAAAVAAAAVVVVVVADVDYKPPPLWLGNLLAFGVLCCLALAWFSFQTHQAQQAFLEDSASHARMLADAVSLHARGAVLGHQVTDAMLIGFLSNSARFIDYLDRVEPFRDQELTAFAAEAGLSAIRVIRPDSVNQGPPDWNPGASLNCDHLQRLLSLPDIQELAFGAPRQGRAGCVLVSMDSRPVDELRNAIGLARALEAAATLPGVIRAKITGNLAENTIESVHQDVPEVAIRQRANGVRVVETRTRLGDAELVVDLDAGPLARTEERLWREFAGFAFILASTGGLGAWLLYRYQRAHLEQLRAYEHRLSQQREDAALGQTAAAIAHEIRNPLNAMAMGLQRLQIEADELSSEHRRLVAVVLEAVGRSNRSVSGLLDYARLYQPCQQPVALDALVDDLLTLYAGRLQKAGIELRRHLALHDEISGDPDLLRQVVDNLLRNALEAQPEGGWLVLRLQPVAAGLELTLTNPGFLLPPEEAPRLLEPWVTTKPGGAGLGLAISRRIVAAHGGRLTIATPQPGQLELRLFLPRR
ncbi:MAG TPA: ATP-binding protein [Candidatus Competibacteraceae bacterium]|nr:ATP-binding protein [Candidatus Competibacteraceae bacterium]